MVRLLSKPQTNLERFIYHIHNNLNSYNMYESMLQRINTHAHTDQPGTATHGKGRQHDSCVRGDTLRRSVA